MEQFSRHDIEQLVRRTRGMAPPQHAHSSLWARGVTPGAGASAEPTDMIPADVFPGDASASASPVPLGAALPMMGIERRLARRAEALWESLRGNSRLPPAAAAAGFLAPPFADHAMQVGPARGPGPSSPGSLAVSFVGAALLKLGFVERGWIQPDGAQSAPLGAQLVFLAQRAMASGTPLLLASESAQVGKRCEVVAPLLLRAIALPFLADAGSAAQAIVITSWRLLLSADETVALHRELAAAIDWMHTRKTDG